MVEQTPLRQISVSGNTINKLAEAIAGIASQQRPQTLSALLKSTTTNTFIFDGKGVRIDLFEKHFRTMLKMQPKMSEAMKKYQIQSHLQKEALQTFRNIIAIDKRTLEYVLIIFRRMHIRLQSQCTAKRK